MKKLFLAFGCAFSWLAAQPAMAQYYIVPNLRAGRNPGYVNTDGEGRYDLGQPGWNLLVTGDAATQSAPAWSPVQTLPFGFQMNGQTFNSYKVSTSGVLTFTTSATSVPATFNTALPSPQIPDNSVCIWGLLMTASNDYMISKTFGTAPRRQHWIQFNSASLPTGSTSVPITGGFVYCSMVLEEGSNKVYMVWQRSGPNGQTLTAGIQLDGTQAVQVPASPNVSIPDLGDATPADNAYYEFTPGTQPALDIAADLLRLPNSATRQSSVSIRGAFRNLGTQTITNLTANYRVGNGPVVSAPLSGYSVGLFDTATFVHPTAWQPSAGGVIPLKVWFSSPNGGVDQQPSNDTLRATVVVADSSMRRKVVQEDFTSSTCPPCRPGNINTRNINTQPANRNKFVEIKYQQNFPAPGTDPYYTVESGARFNYYSGSFVPYMLLDGTAAWDQVGGGNSNYYTAATLNQYYARPALARITGDYTLTRGNTVTVSANIKPLLPVPADRMVVHMVVTERETRNNARTNGETRFYDVMKKMLPNQNGTNMPATGSGQTFTLNQTFNISTLPASQAVENFDSLRVVVFVQDLVTKEIYQGEYLNLRNPLGTRHAQSGTAFELAPNPSTGQTTLYTSLARPETVRVEVLDVLGRVVLERKQLALGSGAQEIPLNLTQQAAGLYTVRLVTSQGVRTSKLTLE
ncbi:hypothetical protein GCM10023185_07260 [Hymenobacter saemangeumensis]|uniref:Secretion system C-terminal sorting domain-containing protein n=1 Tax=Hymenobacter saemangeumensis TaxID=1084522 RepID=A0ABP8I2E7_9BACT